MNWLEWVGVFALIVVACWVLAYVTDRWNVWMMYLGMAMSDRKRWKRENRK